MCIRDRADEILNSEDWLELPTTYDIHEWEIMRDFSDAVDDERLRNELLDAVHGKGCLLYTSDAADERSSVDLGGRRIIKKKKNKERTTKCIIQEMKTSIS